MCWGPWEQRSAPIPNLPPLLIALKVLMRTNEENLSKLGLFIVLLIQLHQYSTLFFLCLILLSWKFAKLLPNTSTTCPLKAHIATAIDPFSQHSS